MITNDDEEGPDVSTDICRGCVRSITLSDSNGEPVFGITVLSFTDQALSVAWRPYLPIYVVSPNSRVEEVLDSF